MPVSPFSLYMDLAPIYSASRAGSTVTVTTAYTSNLPPIDSATRASSTVTIVTISDHNLTTGATVVVSDITGAAGTSMNGTFVVTVTDSLTFTYTAAGTAGTGTVDDSLLFEYIVAPHGIVSDSYVQIGGITGTAGTSMAGVYQVTATGSATFTYTSAGTAGDGTVTAGFAAVDLFSSVANYSAANRSGALYVDLGSMNMSASGDGATQAMSLTILQDVTPTSGPWFLTVPDQTRIRLVNKETGVAPASNGSDVLFTGTIGNVSARLNDSNQGTEAEVTLDDINLLLDRTVVAGRTVSAKTPEDRRAFRRSSNVVTVTTKEVHNYTAGLTKIVIAGVMNDSRTSGKTGTFNGTFTVASTPTTKTFTYASTGSNGYSADFGVSVKGNAGGSAGIFRVAKSANQITVNFGTKTHGLTAGASVIVTGVTGTLGDYINGLFDASQVTITNTSVIRLTLLDAPPSWPGSIGDTFARVRGVPSIVPVGGGGQIVVPIKAGSLEADSVRAVLSTVNSYKSTDYPYQRLFNTAGTASVSGGTAFRNQIPFGIPAGTLRETLDTLLETYGGQDKLDRRYFISPDGALTYRLIDSSAVPAFPTAPYSLTTDAIQSPNGTASKATLNPYSLEFSYDHNTTKGALVNIVAKDNSVSSFVKTYTDTDIVYRKRGGAAVFDEIVDYPTAITNPTMAVTRAAASFFRDRHKQLITGTATIRGAGTESFNRYGFSAGYAQTGASTFALVEKWAPGQYVEITAQGYGIATPTLFRIESVEWGLEEGSFLQRIVITFSRRNPNSLSGIVGMR